MLMAWMEIFDRPITVTTSPNRSDMTRTVMWSMLLDEADLFWVKLANADAIEGIEAHYDAGVISLEEAAANLRKHNLEGILSTSELHTTEKPQWRVLCPTSQPLPLLERQELVTRLNDIFGGVLAKASFEPSHGVSFGGEHSLIEVQGRAIDMATELKPRDPSWRVPRPTVPNYAAAVIKLLEDMPHPIWVRDDTIDRVNLAVQGCIGVCRAKEPKFDPSMINAAAAAWTARAVYPKERDYSKVEARGNWVSLLMKSICLGVDIHKFEEAYPSFRFDTLEPLDPEERASPPAPLVLDRNNPLASARELVARQFSIGSHGRLIRHGGIFHRWVRTHYALMPDDALDAVVWSFLGSASVEVIKKGQPTGIFEPFSPQMHHVTNVVAALKGVTHLSSDVTVSAWLGPFPEAPAEPSDDIPTVPWYKFVYNLPPASEFISFKNELLHVPTRISMIHTPRFFNSYAIGYDYEPDAPEPARWLAFLRAIWPEDNQSIDTLQEIIGLLVAGDARYHKIFMLVGPKRSGKGTIARVLTELIGPQNVCNPTLSSLAQNFGAAPLIGKPLATITDARLSGRADLSAIAERLLSISGGDDQTIDRKHREAWTGRLPTRFLVLTNELPRLTDASAALVSRFIVLQMTRSFYGEEDLDLTDKLLSELPGILNWALAGLDRLTARKRFIQPASAQETLDDFEGLTSPITAFLKDVCATGPDQWVSREVLFTEWVTWCRSQGQHAGSMAVFGKNLKAALPSVAGTKRSMPDEKGRVNCYLGVGVPVRGRFAQQAADLTLDPVEREQFNRSLE